MDTEQPAGAPIVGPGDLLAAAMDGLAMNAHENISAADRHWQIAIHLWPALKSLGYTQGNMIAAGADADLLAGRPPHPRHEHSHGRRLAFRAPIPPGTQWPHQDLPLGVRPNEDDRDLYDVAIGNLPYHDVVFANDADRTVHGRYHSDLITTGLSTTRPGGITVALAGQMFLDHPDPEVRGQVVDLADLLGAVRLPSGAMRPDSHADGPVDILLLQRRPPGASPAGADFAASGEVSIDQARCHVNEYWLTHRENVLGTLAPSQWSGISTVKPGPEHLGKAMQSAFTQIRDAALAARMTAPGSGDAPPTTGTSLPDAGARRSQGHRHGPSRPGPDL